MSFPDKNQALYALGNLRKGAIQDAQDAVLDALILVLETGDVPGYEYAVVLGVSPTETEAEYGDTVVYTITLTNNSPKPLPDGAQVTSLVVYPYTLGVTFGTDVSDDPEAFMWDVSGLPAGDTATGTLTLEIDDSRGAATNTTFIEVGNVETTDDSVDTVSFECTVTDPEA